MKARIKLLSLTVWLTVWLLAIGATLMILGIFNERLRWDIFSPQAEAVLYGIFFSCITLSAFGVAITFVLGMKQIVEAVESLQQTGNIDRIVSPKVQRLTYIGYTIGLLIAFSALIGGLGLLDYQIQMHRSQVFKQIALEQLQKFRNQLAQPLKQRSLSSPSSVPKPITELMNALSELSFVAETTLYVPDSQSKFALWRYRPHQTNAKGQPIFGRFLIAKEFEEAIQQALNGNTKALEDLNRQTDLTWYYLVKDSQETPLAVLRIKGNPRENFREYTAEPMYQQNGG